MLMENKSEIHVALTGHRPPKLGGYDITTKEYNSLQKDLELLIEEYLEDHDSLWGHSGLALGADTVWSKAILNMKAKYPERVFFHAEIPMMTQSSKWFKKEDKEFWQEQLDQCDKYSLYSNVAPNEHMDKRMAVEALNKRNIGMIDHADVVVAIWDGSNSGTKHAVTHAKRTDKEVIQIYPHDYFK